MKSKYDELLQEYKLLTMRADKRLQRLEEASTQPHFKEIKQYAYARAMRDIRSWSGLKGTRFGTKPPGNVQQLQAKINDIKKFLDSPTSTKRGVINIYKKRADTVNKTYKTNFKWQDLANYYESDMSKDLDSQYGSDTLIRAIGAIKRIANDPDKIAAAINGTSRLADDDVLNEIARNILANNRKITDLF